MATSSSDAAPRWLADGEAHVWRPYCQHHTAPRPLPVREARGSRLVLSDGRELIDGIASWWTAAHGYQHPHLVAAVAAQLQRLPHVAFGGLAHEGAYELCRRLATLLPAPLSRVFLVESGSVAVEVALKICRQAAANQGHPERRRVMAFDGGYHGDTFATMRLCDPVDGMHRAFPQNEADVLHAAIPSDDEEWAAFEARFAREAPSMCGVIIEPLLQAAGGMRLHSSDVLRRLRALCDAHGVWLVFDEIATGFFRTGSRFALDEAGVTPDVVTLGKALTGGMLPLACAVASEALFEAFLDDEPSFALQHGPTYMGNALACAAALASLDLFDDEGMATQVARLSGWLWAGLRPLREHPLVLDVRVKGAMGAVVLRPGAAPSSESYVQRGVFLRPLRLTRCDVLYLMPPLVLSEAEAALACGAIVASLDALR